MLNKVETNQNAAPLQPWQGSPNVERRGGEISVISPSARRMTPADVEAENSLGEILKKRFEARTAKKE